MQKHRCYSVYDVKTQAYMIPFYHQSNGSATRAFANAVNDFTHPFHTNPEDYTLFYLGEFNDKNAEFEGLVTPEPITKAIHLKQTTPPEGTNGQS